MNAWTARILAATAFVLPLVYWPGIYDFTRWPRLLLLQLLLAGATAVCFARRNERLPLTPPLLAAVAYFAWSLVSALWAVNPVESLVQANQLFALVVLCLATATLRDEDVPTVAAAWCASGTIAAIVGIGQYLGLGFGWVPTVGNPGATFGYRNLAAAYMAVTLPVAIALAVSSATSRQRALFTVSVVTMSVFLVYTRTRGAWLGLGIAAVGSIVYLVATRGVGGLLPGRRRLVVLACAAAVVLLGALPARMQTTGTFGFDERKTDAVTTLAKTFSPGDARGRFAVWRHTAEMWLDSPIAGVGLGSWPFVYPEYDRGDWITTNVSPVRPHNDWLWVLSETGIVGFALFVFVVVRSLFGAYAQGASSSRRDWLVGLAAGILALSVHACFSFPRERVAPSAAFWMAIGLIALLLRQPARFALPTRFLAAAAPILILGAGFTWQLARFDAAYVQSLMALKRSDWSSAVSHAGAAAAIGPYNYRVYQVAGGALQQLGRHDEAIVAFTRSLDLNPNEGHLPLAQSYEARGLISQAAEHYGRERTLFPRSIDAAVGLGRTLALLDRNPEAIAALTAARDLASNRHDTLLEIGDLLRQAGAYEEAAETYGALLEAGSGTGDLLTKTADALDRAGRMDEALDVYRKAVESAPANARYLNNLGAAFAKRGRRARAKDAFLRAISADPDYANTYHNLGDLLAAEGDTSGAIDAYRRFMARWQGDPRFRNLAAQKIANLEGS